MRIQIFSQRLTLSGHKLFALFALTLATILAGWTSDAGSAELTFEQALKTMLAANESVQTARLEIQRRQFDARAAQGLYFPKVTLSGRWTRIDEPINLDLDPIRDVILALHPAVPASALPSFKQEVQDDTFWKAQLNMVWPVFTGGSITAANKAAEAGFREGDAKFRRTVDTLTADLVRFYFSVRLAEQVVRVRTQAKQVLDQHLFEAQRLYQEGFIAHTELLHAEVAQAQADRKHKASRRDQELARTALAGILASPEPIAAATPLFMVPAMAPVDTFIQHARDKHPAVDQLTAIKDQAHENVIAKKADYWPQVYLFGMRELFEDDLTLLEPAWAAGIGVNIALFEGFFAPQSDKSGS